MQADADAVAACGGLYEASEGSIVSPLDLPQARRGVTCIWTIRVQSNYLPRIEFREFSFKESDNCSSGYIEVGLIKILPHSTVLMLTCFARPTS